MLTDSSWAWPNCSEAVSTALYRGKYILDGLDEIPPDMLRDLDMAYDICQGLKDEHPCEMCGRCCHQPFITVRDEEVASIAEYMQIEPYDFVMDYLERDPEEDKWLFKKTNPCAFLGENNRCRIWGGRPEICDEFPYMVSMFMSRVYLAIVNPDFDIMPSLEYMDDTWPCTKVIKANIQSLIESARQKRSALL